MTLFEAVKNKQELLLKDNKDIVVFKQFSGDFTKNAKRLLRLYDEYIKKYGEYPYMSRDQRYSANVISAFDTLLSWPKRIEILSLIVVMYSTANNYTLYESVRGVLNHWIELPSVRHEEIDCLIKLFELYIKDKGLKSSIIIDPFDSAHLEL